MKLITPTDAVIQQYSGVNFNIDHGQLDEIWANLSMEYSPGIYGRNANNKSLILKLLRNGITMKNPGKLSSKNLLAWIKLFGDLSVHTMQCCYSLLFLAAVWPNLKFIDIDINQMSLPAYLMLPTFRRVKNAHHLVLVFIYRFITSRLHMTNACYPTSSELQRLQ